MRIDSSEIAFLREKDDPSILAERAIIDNIFVDPIDGKYGKPRMLHEAKDIGREVAIATWPDRKTDLLNATSWRSEHQSESGYADPITIAEAWHLPSSSTAGDGRHVICTDTCKLEDEPWKIERYPMAFFRWLEETLLLPSQKAVGNWKGVKELIFNSSCL